MIKKPVYIERIVMEPVPVEVVREVEVYRIKEVPVIVEKVIEKKVEIE